MLLKYSIWDQDQDSKLSLEAWLNYYIMVMVAK